MGRYTVKLTRESDAHLKHWKKVGNKVILRKIEKVFLELKEHPTTGTGKPEPLKGDYIGFWSRRLNHQHRLIYEIIDETVTVYVISMKAHYSDK
jgi:toxin YoeB